MPITRVGLVAKRGLDAAAKEDVREAAGGSAHVERQPPDNRNGERVERVSELDAAASDVGMIGLDQRELGIPGYVRARFRDDLPVDAHLPGEDQRARPLPRRRKPLVDDRDIEPCLAFQLVRAITHCAIAGSWPASRLARSASSARSTHAAAIAREASRP